MRSEFSPETKEVLAKRVGYRCSNPDCRQLTSGPREDPAKFTNIGVAAHITAAAPGGARYDASLTDQARRSAENGIWLCQNHAKLVDNDAQRFPIETLRRWKSTREDAARKELEAPAAADLPIAHEQLRARLAIVGARLRRPLKLGEIPEVELQVVNLGNSTANHITSAHTGMRNLPR